MNTYCWAVIKKTRQFAVADDGAITVDFVVLTAAIMLTGVVVVASFDGEVIRIADDTAEFVSTQLD